MEMPIAVMIMLFISIVVGIGVISFSDTLLTRSQDDLRNLGREERDALEDRLVTLPTLNKNNVRNLAEQCARDKVAVVGREICYVLHGNVQESVNNLDGQELNVDHRTLEFQIQISSSSPNALFMYYNPLGSIEIND